MAGTADTRPEELSAIACDRRSGCEYQSSCRLFAQESFISTKLPAIAQAIAAVDVNLGLRVGLSAQGSFNSASDRRSGCEYQSSCRHFAQESFNSAKLSAIACDRPSGCESRTSCGPFVQESFNSAKLSAIACDRPSRCESQTSCRPFVQESLNSAKFSCRRSLAIAPVGANLGLPKALRWPFVLGHPDDHTTLKSSHFFSSK